MISNDIWIMLTVSWEEVVVERNKEEFLFLPTKSLVWYLQTLLMTSQASQVPNRSTFLVRSSSEPTRNS